MRDLDQMSIYGLCAVIVADQSLKLEIAENMKSYGGSFVKALGNCMLKADKPNLFKLCKAFFSYILDYQPSKWRSKK